MDKVIVYVDDADYARQVLEPLAARAAAATTHWVLVACAPRMTHRISKWVSHSARENWRTRWADKLFAQMHPWLGAAGGRVSTLLATQPLPELLARLQAEHGAATPVLDARRPRQEQAASAAAPAAGRKPPRRWPPPGSLAGLGLLLVLVAD